jgi:squalene synthase HpnC
MGVGHYENFPVASWLLPAALRPAVRAIYRFARTADDVADEGEASPHERLAALAGMHRALDLIEDGQAGNWPDLEAAVRRHALPVAPLRDLLSAFAQDVTVSRYPDYEALLDYCRRSANPVGRLLLALYRTDDPVALQWSDRICTGLQLANFWQDVAVDWAKGRVYLPQSELARFGLDESVIGVGRGGGGWPALMLAQTDRARRMLESGAPLTRRLAGRIGWELRLVVQGGLRILERIDLVDGDVFGRRPQLGPADWLLMAARSLSDRGGGRSTE